MLTFLILLFLQINESLESVHDVLDVESWSVTRSEAASGIVLNVKKFSLLPFPIFFAVSHQFRSAEEFRYLSDRVF